MNNLVNPIPEEYGTITPYLIVEGANDAIAFYQKVFGAVEQMRLSGPEGSVGHAELKIGDSIIMLADPCPAMHFESPKKYGGTPVSSCIYVEKSDEVYAKAIEAGAEEIKPVENQFYGDRSGTIRDPFGHVWTISSRIEKLTPEEVQKRAADFMAKMAAEGGHCQSDG